MIFTLYSELTDANIETNLGRPQYSYYFLLKSFRQIFESLGKVVIVTDPTNEVDEIYKDCLARGEDCLFVCFTPPHLTPTKLQCPTICLFAWEFSTIPCSSWNQDPCNDWCYVFSQHKGVMATSSNTANIVRQAMQDDGKEIPVLAVPSPVWDDFSNLRDLDPLEHLNNGSEISAPGYLQDSNDIEFDLDNLLPRYFTRADFFQIESGPAPTEIVQPASSIWEITKKHWRDFRNEIPGKPEQSKTIDSPNAVVSTEDQCHRLRLNGVVYTTILNPEDGRKCHIDILTAFIWAFRDNPDVTLIMKMTQADADNYRTTLNHSLHQLYPFQCRVIIFNGYLSDVEYQSLLEASTYYVNTSHCEGLCIPLMEYLSAGKLVIAPDHTAMEDYINEDVAFVVESNKETNVWPHDPRGSYTTERYRNNWESIVESYQLSYSLAMEDPDEYRRRSNIAKAQLEDFCSFTNVEKRMQEFLKKDCGFTLK